MINDVPFIKTDADYVSTWFSWISKIWLLSQHTRVLTPATYTQQEVISLMLLGYEIIVIVIVPDNIITSLPLLRGQVPVTRPHCLMNACI